MSVKLHSAEIAGVDATIIDVEVDLSPGLHLFTIVGLADKAVDESRERISAAIKNFGARPPHKRNNRIVVSLAPADLKKEGPAFDLPIALAYLLASHQTEFSPEGKLFLGELALDGTLRRVKGTLAMAQIAERAGFKELYVPLGNGAEAALAHGIAIYEAKTLKDIIYHLEGKELLEAHPPTELPHIASAHRFDFADIRGQETAKRGLEIAATGGHNIALVGPPGTGKTLLSRALPSILPPLSREEAIEVTKIHSISGHLSGDTIVTERPFRSPHHTASHVALVGGGTFPRPGEITLAHRGVLFLDEFPEFERRVIEALRQPLEDGMVSVSRARGSINFPAHIILVAAMNPCPCGNAGSARKECTCAPAQLERYQRKLSGPIIDRIDMWLDVPEVDHQKLASTTPTGETSSTIRTRVEHARNIQKARFTGTPIITNSEMDAKALQAMAPLAPNVSKMLEHAARTMDLSARAYHRIIKISRTIADLANSPSIEEEHILEALQYRPRRQG